MGIHGNGWDCFVWNFKKLSERATKYTAILIEVNKTRCVIFTFMNFYYWLLFESSTKSTKEYMQKYVSLSISSHNKLHEQRYLMRLSFERYFSPDVRSVPQNIATVNIVFDEVKSLLYTKHRVQKLQVRKPS